ncbi:MAG TPA: 2-C-methyl-D-erythritol 2,4-cyclodiphosphate synthase, partial [bacterium]|nr:2-C-methyl-D-erythritol 2,4-cyclodiphosphate synthase [bacterium]
LVERLGRRVRMVEDSPTNIKITVPDDLVLAETLLGGGAAATTRTGMGIDVHRLVPGRPLRLGGVEIPHPLGLAGHSDADVLLHAVMDALLGAAGLGDLGTHFPSEDPAWRGADSLDLLRRVGELLAGAGWSVVHVDAVVLAEAPLLAPHTPRMREAIAGVLGLAAEAVSLKATTAEGLGAVGRGEGITAYALATIARHP